MDMSRAELLALLAMAFGLLMDGLDASIVNIALPSIAEYFGTDTNEVAWVTISYFMMIAGMMLIFGRIADSGHIRKIYIAGFVIFAICQYGIFAALLFRKHKSFWQPSRINRPLNT